MHERSGTTHASAKVERKRVVVDGLAVARQPRRSVHQPARAHRRPRPSSRAAEGRAGTRRTRRTTAPTRARRGRRPRTRVTPLADRLDDARALVPEHGRAPGLRGSVDRVPVRVAHAARAQADEHLLGPGRCELELRHRRADRRSARARPRESSRRAPSPSPAARRSSSIGMWQRMRWPPSTSTSGGSCSTQIGAEEPRAARVEDAARWAGRPRSGCRLRGGSARAPPPSIVGTADSSASVYGWCGPSKTTSAGPSSWTRPR